MDYYQLLAWQLRCNYYPTIALHKWLSTWVPVYLPPNWSAPLSSVVTIHSTTSIYTHIIFVIDGMRLNLAYEREREREREGTKYSLQILIPSLIGRHQTVSMHDKLLDLHMPSPGLDLVRLASCLSLHSVNLSSYLSFCYNIYRMLMCICICSLPRSDVRADESIKGFLLGSQTWQQWGENAKGVSLLLSCKSLGIKSNPTFAWQIVTIAV